MLFRPLLLLLPLLPLVLTHHPPLSLSSLALSLHVVPPSVLVLARDLQIPSPPTLPTLSLPGSVLARWMGRVTRVLGIRRTVPATPPGFAVVLILRPLT